MPEKLEIIAHIRTPFPEKFGVPRQSGLIPGLTGRIIFEKKYRSETAIRGIEGFSHLWLLWLFSENREHTGSLTVRPPRLGGNTRMGVFATRSPFRPNGIGMSCVRLCGVERGGEDSPVLVVEGADLLDNTPIIDVKPYLPFTDSRPEAACGFAGENFNKQLSVSIPPREAEKLPDGALETVTELLASDPRPSYQEDGERIYGMRFSDFEIKFTVNGDKLAVTGITERKK